MDHGELPPKKKKKKTKKAVAFEEPAAPPAPAPEEQAEEEQAEEEVGWGAFCDSLELDRRLARAVAQLGRHVPTRAHDHAGLGLRCAPRA